MGENQENKQLHNEIVNEQQDNEESDDEIIGGGM